MNEISEKTWKRMQQFAPQIKIQLCRSKTILQNEYLPPTSVSTQPTTGYIFVEKMTKFSNICKTWQHSSTIWQTRNQPLLEEQTWHFLGPTQSRCRQSWNDLYKPAAAVLPGNLHEFTYLVILAQIGLKKDEAWLGQHMQRTSCFDSEISFVRRWRNAFLKQPLRTVTNIFRIFLLEILSAEIWRTRIEGALSDEP